MIPAMLPKRFTDPLGSKLPAFEQNILKLRAMEMVLVLFYAEELKREVLDLIQTTDRFIGRLRSRNPQKPRIPKGTKKPVEKALTALVADRAITTKQKRELVGLIDYRNTIAHQLHNLLLDLSPDQFAREMLHLLPERVPRYNYNAVERCQHFLNHFAGLYKTHHYVRTLPHDHLVFRSTEKTFLAEVKRLRRKISRLAKIRENDIKKLNVELSLDGSGLEGELHPRHPLSQYDDGRLTKRGVEICYRLFDMGKSTMAVAHLTGLSLKAATKRQKMWRALGNRGRAKVDIKTLPRR